MKKTLIDLEEIEKIDNCLFVLVRIGMSRRVRVSRSVSGRGIAFSISLGFRIWES